MTSALHIRSSSPVDDAVQLGRRVRDLAVDGSTQMIANADVPHLVEVGRESAAAAVSDAIVRITGRRRRRWPSRLVSVAVVGVSLALVASAWRFIRSGALSRLRSTDRDDEDIVTNLSPAVDQALDADALARATDDGMGIVGAVTETVFPAPEDGPFGDPEGMLAEPA